MGKLSGVLTRVPKSNLILCVRKGTEHDKQFEYNTYIRDFFEDNQGKSLEEAIMCWKYKKGLQGHNRYDQSDLVALEHLVYGRR